MPIDYVKRPTAAPRPAVSLEKVAAVAPGLVDLYKTAQSSVAERGLAGERVAVYLVLDRSGSMRALYKSGAMQRLAEQVLALAAHFDDDGVVPVVFFDTEAHDPVAVSLEDYAGRIDEAHEALGHMGRTNYAAAMRTVIEHHQQTSPTSPALVVFQTDGSPENRRAATETLCDAAKLPIFWQFIGFGDDEFLFLRKLDELEVPKHRVIDNAGFEAAGPDPAALAASEVYAMVTAEFPTWLREARAAGIAR